MKENLNEDEKNKGKSTPPKITPPSMMEIFGNEDNTDEEKKTGLDVEEGEKSIDTEN